MNRKLITLLLVIIMSLAVVTTASAITWGEPDNGEHPNVGTLLFVQNGVGYFSCSGTMIAPRVMLTAGHCVEGGGNINEVTYVRFEEDALSGISDYGSLQEWFDAEWMATETVIPHPQYADFAEFPQTYDVGVVILAEPYYPSNGFGTLPSIGFLEELRGRDRLNFESVGYGLQGTLRPFEMDEYARYKGDVALLEVQSWINGSQSAKFSNNPGIGGGTCYGDSGGPTFFGDTNVVVSVTSFGWAKNGNCVGNDFNFRTDIPAAQDFLNWVLDEYGG
ncbi:MAG TPA: trypsin-like serine protease [Candidatus Sulfomarinibacteraceae bacterium]|nr:trypsin-like serine protease [Candidatus Sulfomarinibacteraceae bacterium]